MNGKRLSGMIVASLSPVDMNESYDYGLLKTYVDYLVVAGCDAMFALGSTGTFPVLSVDERKAFAEGYVKAVNGRMPLCVHVGSDTEENTVELARHAGAVGVDAIAAVPPYYYKFGPHCVQAYFERIAAVNPDLPFYIYNIPMFAHADVTPQQLKAMKQRIPNLAGVKDTTQDYPRFVDYCDVMGLDFDNLMGSDAMCLAALQTGGAGGICAMAAHNPELMVALFAAYHAGDLKRARKLQFLAARIRLLFQQLPFMSPRIEILHMRGIISAGYKRPFLPLNPDQSRILRDTLKRLSDEFEFPLL